MPGPRRHRPHATPTGSCRVAVAPRWGDAASCTSRRAVPPVPCGCCARPDRLQTAVSWPPERAEEWASSSSNSPLPAARTLRRSPHRANPRSTWPRGWHGGCLVHSRPPPMTRRTAGLSARRPHAASVGRLRPVTREPTNQGATPARSAPAMPPRQLRVLHRLVMGSPEEYRVQALDLHSKFAGSMWRKHEQCVLQLVPGPALAAAGAGELRLTLPPPAPRAVNAYGPHTQRHRHDARRQSLPFEHTDSGIRRSRQTWDIAIPHPGSVPAALPRPK